MKPPIRTPHGTWPLVLQPQGVVDETGEKSLLTGTPEIVDQSLRGAPVSLQQKYFWFKDGCYTGLAKNTKRLYALFVMANLLITK